MKKKSSFHCLGVPIVKKFIKGINYELVGLLNLKKIAVLKMESRRTDFYYTIIIIMS